MPLSERITLGDILLDEDGGHTSASPEHEYELPSTTEAIGRRTHGGGGGGTSRYGAVRCTSRSR